MVARHSEDADELVDVGGVLLHLPPSLELTDDQFFDFCQANRDLRIERTAQGEIVIMPPTGGTTGARNLQVSAQLLVWADREGSGVAFDSSTGFRLPNRATRSPDAAWVRRSRLAPLSDEEKERFLPLCPDFVIELKSHRDRLRNLHAKMAEYVENGAQLGWLIDPQGGRVYVYRPGRAVETLDTPAQLSADPELPGFALELARVWQPL